MTFEEIQDEKLVSGELLWRYMDLHKFISFISNRKLFFSRLDQFEDPFEGVSLRLIQMFSEAKNTPQREEINPIFSEETKETILQSAENKRTLFHRESPVQQKCQFVNCWILTERESMSMWNMYSNKNSIAIQYEGRSLVDYFKANVQDLTPHHDFICGKINYRKIYPPDYSEKSKPTKYSALKKDVAFEFEKEYRFLIATPTTEVESNPTFFEIELSSELFKSMRVICHPQMENWKFENIKTLCHSFEINEPKKSKIYLKT